MRLRGKSKLTKTEMRKKIQPKRQKRRAKPSKSTTPPQTWKSGNCIDKRTLLKTTQEEKERLKRQRLQKNWKLIKDLLLKMVLGI